MFCPDCGEPIERYEWSNGARTDECQDPTCGWREEIPPPPEVSWTPEESQRITKNGVVNPN